MKSLRAVTVQTIRSAIRSHVFHVLFVLIGLAMFALPLLVAGDGTARGLVQIALTYSLGVVVALISTTTLWIACSQLPREVEDYTIHMIATKPCPRWHIWAGKWLGVFIMNGLIFIVSAGIIYGLVFTRLSWAQYKGRVSKIELERLRAEVLVGRREFQPMRPNFGQLAQTEYEQRLADGRLESGHNPQAVKTEILRQVRNKSAEVPLGASKKWVYTGVSPDGPDDVIFLRYRHYAESTSRSAQRLLRGIWSIRDPSRSTADQDVFDHFGQQVLSGGFHELPIPGRYVAEDGVLVVQYTNPPEAAQSERDPSKNSVIFQLGDGPVLLIRESGFLSNYIRSMVLGLFQLAFLAALGCTVGAAFSTPVAAFVAVAYLVIGMSVQAAVDAPLKDDFGRPEYKGVADRAAHLVAKVTKRVVVSVSDLDATSDLARGRLVGYGRLASSLLFLIVIRGGLMAALGMWILKRRELGAVIRR